MSVFLNPTVSSLLYAHGTNNLPYLARDSMRVSSEYAGLPMAVDPKRKMDYMFRNFHGIFITSFGAELAFRLIDEFFVLPNYRQILKLGQIKHLYTPNGLNDVHIPPSFKLLPRSILTKAYDHGMPDPIRKHMVSSLVNPRSFALIPNLIAHEDLVALQDKLKMLKQKKAPQAKIRALQNQIDETRLLAHHFRRMLNPESYIDEHLLAHRVITPDEATLLKENLTHMEDWVKRFEKAQAGHTPKDILETLQTQAKRNPSKVAKQLATLSEAQIQRMLHGSSWHHTMSDVFRLGFSGLSERQRLSKLAAQPAFRFASQQPTADLLALKAELARLGETPAFKDSAFIQNLCRYNDKQLATMVKGPTRVEYKKIWRDFVGRHVSSLQKWLKPMAKSETNTYYLKRSLSFSDELLAEVRQHIMLPLFQSNHSGNAKLVQLFHDLSESKLCLKQAQTMFQNSAFWLKLPLSVVFLFIGMGIVSNVVDAKVVQPYQRELVRQRGDSTEFLGPGYYGAIPGVAVFAALMAAPAMKRLGYAGQFAAAALTGMATYAASTIALFNAKISKPRTTPPAPTTFNTYR